MKLRCLNSDYTEFKLGRIDIEVHLMKSSNDLGEGKLSEDDKLKVQKENFIRKEYNSVELKI